MPKKDRGMSVNLDSFLDLMTCMLGVLVLMILLTGIDASQIKILVPTPIEYETDRRTIFIECRSNELFLISVDEINKLANDTLKELADKTKGDERAFVNAISSTVIKSGAYEIDLSFALIGQYALRPLPDVRGYAIKDAQAESPKTWYGQLLLGINRDEEMITFLVRDDSFSVFKKARALAWVKNIPAACEILDMNDPLKFGLGGRRALAQ